MNKKTIIRTLEKIALYMELQGENPFKVGAFRKAAQTLELDPRSLSEMDDILTLKGIGKGTGAVITDLMEKGKSDLLEELERVVPSGLLPLLKLPGLGGKKIAKLHQELGVESPESLQSACERGEVSKLAGFGKKTEEKLLKELQSFQSIPTHFPIWAIDTIVKMIEQELSNIEEITKYSPAGSYRRRKEFSSDIDFVMAVTDPELVRDKILNALPISEIIAAGDTKVSVKLDIQDPVDVDFRFVTEEQYASTLHHFTGSKEHNVKMRQLAKSMGKKISEYGVEQEDGTVETFKSEEEFFRHFGLPFIPPTVRKDGTELDRLDELSTLIQPEDILSDLHMHTTWSDGAHSIQEMVEANRLLGRRYMVITDHSQYLKVANGLTPSRLRKQMDEIRNLQLQYDDIRIFCGTEMDILPDATLDFDDELLADLDFVIASIHSSFSQPQEKIMERILTAMKNPHVDMIAHPTGRIIGQRPGYEPDVPQLIQWAKEYGKIVELNANPFRLDLAEEYLAMAQELGVPIAINTDAHSIDQLNVMPIGVQYGQRAWLKKENVVNTWSIERFTTFLKK